MHLSPKRQIWGTWRQWKTKMSTHLEPGGRAASGSFGGLPLPSRTLEGASFPRNSLCLPHAHPGSCLSSEWHSQTLNSQDDAHTISRSTKSTAVHTKQLLTPSSLPPAHSEPGTSPPALQDPGLCAGCSASHPGDRHSFSQARTLPSLPTAHTLLARALA